MDVMPAPEVKERKFRFGSDDTSQVALLMTRLQNALILIALTMFVEASGSWVDSF